MAKAGAVFLAVGGMALFAPIASASLINPFSGTGTLQAADFTAGTNAPSYSTLVEETVGFAKISYSVTITSLNPSFNVSIDTGSNPRGFGRTGESNPALNFQGDETLVVTIGPVTAEGVGGSSVVSNDVTAKFDSFDLVNNGSNPPTILWNVDSDPQASLSAPGGSTGGTHTTQAIATSGTVLTLEADASWMWVDQVVTSFSGSVTTVPEPATALGLIGLISGAFFRRKRRLLG